MKKKLLTRSDRPIYRRSEFGHYDKNLEMTLKAISKLKRVICLDPSFV